MRRIVWIALVVFPICANAQKFGVKGGVNFATINDGNNNSFKTSFHVGVFALFNLAENIKLMPEINYSVQGAKGISYSLNYNYINIPVVVNIYETKHLFFQLGGQVGFLTSAEIVDNGITNNVKNDLNKIDYALVGGLGVDLGRLLINARYNWGFMDIVKSNSSAIVQKSDVSTNAVIQLSVGVKIN